MFAPTWRRISDESYLTPIGGHRRSLLRSCRPTPALSYSDEAADKAEHLIRVEERGALSTLHVLNPAAPACPSGRPLSPKAHHEGADRWNWGRFSYVRVPLSMSLIASGSTASGLSDGSKEGIVAMPGGVQPRVFIQERSIVVDPGHPLGTVDGGPAFPGHDAAGRREPHKRGYEADLTRGRPGVGGAGLARRCIHRCRIV